MAGIHGGDIYRNRVELDFSVNVNPLGMPKGAEAALRQALGQCGNYPDIEAEKLKQAASQMLSVPKEYLIFGNGASELLMAIVHAIRPRKALIPIPSFYGYEHAAKAGAGSIAYYQTAIGQNFCFTEEICKKLTNEISLLFLANPNNPNGGLIKPEILRKILCHCREKGIYVALDECFIEFCETEASMLPELAQWDNLIIVRAFTKIFAIPGIRLGYLACGSHSLLSNIRRQLPEWNLSCFAHAAGCACAAERNYRKETVALITQERQFLEQGLKRLGIFTFPSEACFLLAQTESPLYESLLKKGILIRDCQNFRGLGKGFYRIAVKTREENQRLLKAIETTMFV